MIIAWWLTLSALASDWRLSAAYDMAAVAALNAEEPTYVWRVNEGMAHTCGPAKSPDGLGMFEAEVLANGLAPTLALILERRVDPEAAANLTSRDVRVSLGMDDPNGGEPRRVLLQPMVEPRHLAVDLRAGEGLERFRQLVRTQIEVEACLEHKVGRGWTGHDAERLRQAFLLTPPRSMLPSRKYFGGERDPVPGMLGPPDACVMGPERDGGPQLGRGEGSLTLVPTDVWGAQLRACETEAVTGAVLGTDRTVPLAFTGQPAASRRERWTTLSVQLDAASPTPVEKDVHVRVEHEGVCTFEGSLFRSVGTQAALEDLLARVPHHYPRFEEDGLVQILLLVPNWQLVEALRQLSAADPSTEADLPPAGIIDGVGFILAHPEHLYVQIDPTADDVEAPDACPAAPDPDLVEPEVEPWPNLAGVMMAQTVGEPWGYTVGLLAGRSPIALARATGPTWAQTTAAQRAMEEATLLISLFGLLIIGILGVRRVPDLWTQVPVERAWYWPGRSKVVAGEDTVKSPTEMP